MWFSNKNAWMTTVIFEEWFTELNRKMKKEKWKILLLTDNATSHCVTKIMRNVTVKVLPPNLTSEVQPLDQGFIRAVKACYRKMMLQYVAAITQHSSTKPDLK
jgi:hypothetical protein